MRRINIHEAKTHLSRLVEEAARGDHFVIAKAGKPIAQVVGLEESSAPGRRRLGFLCGEIVVPDDFDQLGASDVEALFGVVP